MSEESNWLARRVALAGGALLTAAAVSCAPAALADTAQTTGATTGADTALVQDQTATADAATAAASQAGVPVADAASVPELAGGTPPAPPDGQGPNPRPGMDPVGAPEKRHGAQEGEELAPAVKVAPECDPDDDCVTLWVWGASMMVDPDITIRQLNAWRAQAAEKGARDAEGNAIAGEPLVWSDSLAFAAQELAVELALGGGDASTLERLNGSGSVVAGQGNTFFSDTDIIGANVSNLTSVQGALDAWYVESDAYWYGPASTVYYLTNEYANAVSNDAKAVGMAAVMLSNQEVYIVCLFGDEVPEQVGDATYAPTTGGAIYQGVNVRRDSLSLQLVAPGTLTAGGPVELSLNASTTLSGNAVGRDNGVAIDSGEVLSHADVQVVQDGQVVGEVVDGVLQADEGFASGAATLQVVMAGQVVASADVELVAVPEGLDAEASFDVDVAAGGSVELPQTAPVRWSGGAVSDEPLTWDALTDEQLAVVAGREGGSFEVAGTVGATGQAVTAHVSVEPASALSAEAPAAQQIWVGGAPELPQTVAVTWSNGDVTDEPVSWGEFDASVPGDFEVEGAVACLAEPVRAQVGVMALQVASVEGQAVQVSVASGTSAAGLVPAELSVATVTWSDGSQTQEQIAWDAPTDEQLAVLASRQGGTFDLPGTVGDTGVAASATVTVEPAAALSAEAPSAQQIWVGGAPELPQTVAVTWSNGDVTDEAVSWQVEEGAFVQPGTAEVAGTVGDTGLTVSASVEVRPLEAKGLGEVAGLDASVPSGTAAADALASLPATAPVSWSDGSVTEEPIAWPALTAEQEATLAGRNGGSFEVTGIVGDTAQTVTATVEVAPAAPVSVQVAPIEQDVWVAGSVELPPTASVTWSNGDVTDEPIAWEEPDLSQAGTVEVHGTVEGLADPVVETFEVKQPQAEGLGEVAGLDASVPSGTSSADALASLPATAPVSWSDGSVTEEPIVWADLDEAQQAVLSSREGGTLEVSGEVAAAGQTVTATVEVAPAQVVSAQGPASQQVWVGGTPDLPQTVAVTWSNGDVTDEPVTWEEPDLSQAGTVEVHGTVEGLADPVVAQVEVEQPVATSVELAVQSADGVEVEPGELPELPDTAQVTWSDGTASDEAVTWDMPRASELKAGSDVSVTGEVPAAQQQVEVSVHVKDAPQAPADDAEGDASAQAQGAAAAVSGTKASSDASGSAASESAQQTGSSDAAPKADESAPVDDDSSSGPAASSASGDAGAALTQTEASDASGASASSGTASTPSGSTASSGPVSPTASDAADSGDASSSPAATPSSPSAAQPARPSEPASTSQDAAQAQQAGLPAWVIATLAGLGAALVAAVAFLVAKRRHADEDDEPIGKHARRP